MKALVSIITVNYNGLRDTCEMIDSSAAAKPIRDTKSSLWTTARACPRRKRYRNDTGQPQCRAVSYQAAPSPFPVKVVRNINNGFAGGNNAGLKAAAGDYLINNDTLIKEPVLDALVRRIESDSPRNGGVSPMLVRRPSGHPAIRGLHPLSPVTLRNTAIGFMQQDSPRFRIPAKPPRCMEPP